MLTMATGSRFHLMLLLFALPTVGECETSSSVVGRVGQDVTLPCRYDIRDREELSVCWNRGNLPSRECRDQLVATGMYKETEGTRVSSRYQLLGRLDEGDVSLTILNVTQTDAGRYGCRARVPGWFNDLKLHIDLMVETGQITTGTTEQQGSDVTTWCTSDVTVSAESDITPTESTVPLNEKKQQQVNTLQSFIGNTLRVTFIIFITGLLPTAAHRVYVWRRNQRSETDRRLGQSEEDEMGHTSL